MGAGAWGWCPVTSESADEEMVGPLVAVGAGGSVGCLCVYLELWEGGPECCRCCLSVTMLVSDVEAWVETLEGGGLLGGGLRLDTEDTATFLV